MVRAIFSMIVPEQRPTAKVENKHYDELANCLADDHLGHPHRDQWCRLPVGLAVQDCTGWRVCGKGKRCKGIHDEINPEQLHGFKN